MLVFLAGGQSTSITEALGVAKGVEPLVHLSVPSTVMSTAPKVERTTRETRRNIVLLLREIRSSHKVRLHCRLRVGIIVYHMHRYTVLIRVC